MAKTPKTAGGKAAGKATDKTDRAGKAAKLGQPPKAAAEAAKTASAPASAKAGAGKADPSKASASKSGAVKASAAKSAPAKASPAKASAGKADRAAAAPPEKAPAKVAAAKAPAAKASAARKPAAGKAATAAKAAPSSKSASPTIPAKAKTETVSTPAAPPAPAEEPKVSKVVAPVAAAAIPAAVAAERAPIRSAKASEAKAKRKDEDDDEDEDDDDEDDEDDDDDLPVNYTATEAVGAFSTVFGFVRPFLPAHKTGILLVFMGLLVETFFNVLMPIILKYLIDDVFPDKDYDELVWSLTVLFGAGLITSVVAIWYEWQDSKVTAAIVADVRRNMFDHIQKLPIAFYNRSKKGEILSRFSNDMTTFEEAVINVANWGVLPLMELMAGIVLLLFLNWQLGLVACLIFPLVLIGPKIITPRAVTASYDLKRSQAGELGVVQENVGAQTVVKAFGLQGISRLWFLGKNEMLKSAQQRSTFLNTMVERSITISVLWLHLIVLAVGAYLTFHDVITVGTFVAFESVFWEITYNINHLTQYIPVVIDASGAVRHMNELMNEPIRVSDKPDATEMPRISKEIGFEKVVFSYDGRQNQLKGLNLTIPAGRRVAIVGPSGAGKSTILNLVMRLYDPKAGRVTIDGIDIAGVTRDSLRANMAIVFQENVLFNTTFRENIRLGNLKATDAEVEAAAKAAEIHRFIMGLPQGYDTVVGERGDTLSGGQRQRIAIARALVRDPAILLLDEATSALDQTTEAAINKTLKKIGKGRTVLFITHRLTSVTDMDEVIVLENGNMVQRGTHDSLMRAKGGLYKKLWDDQMRALEAGDEDDDDDED